MSALHADDTLYYFVQPDDRGLTRYECPILRVTARLVIIERPGWDGPRLHLDRDALERDGSAWSDRAGSYFYTAAGIAEIERREAEERADWERRRAAREAANRAPVLTVVHGGRH